MRTPLTWRSTHGYLDDGRLAIRLIETPRGWWIIAFNQPLDRIHYPDLESATAAAEAAIATMDIPAPMPATERRRWVPNEGPELAPHPD